MRWFLQRVELLRERNRLEAIVRAQTAEIHRLRETLKTTRDELNRWGHGDFHYGAQAQERSVVDAVARADAALGREAVGE